MQDYLLYLHITSGFVALFTGVVPMFTKKGDILHKRAGRIYFTAMTLVFITAIPLSLFSSNYFLFSIAIFSYYAAFSGFRAVRRKNQAPSVLDQAATGLTLAISLSMLGFGSYLILKVHMSLGFVLSVFGVLAFLMSLQDARIYWFGHSPDRYGKKFWFFNHIQRIGGSYIAAFTAFTVTNIKFIPDVVGWLGPTVVGTILIARSSRHYARKFFEKKPQP